MVLFIYLNFQEKKFVPVILEKKEKSEPKRRKSGGSQGCPFYKQDPLQFYKDSVLMDVCDIEQLVGLGRQMKACPYYGTRLAIPDAEVSLNHSFKLL